MPNLKFNLKAGSKFKFDLKMKLIAIGSVCLIFVIIWFLIISGYQSGKSSSIISQGEVLKAAYKSKYQYLIDMKEAAKKTDEEQKIATQVYAKLLPVSNKVSSIDAITQMGNEEKLKFVFFKPKPVVRYKDYQVIPMDLSLYGPFDGLVRFMNKLNKDDSTILISNFVIMRRGDAANEVIMNATLNIYNGISEEDKKAAIDAANAAEAAKKPVSKAKKNDAK